MLKKAVYGVVANHAIAGRVVRALNSTGFQSSDISALFSQFKSTRAFAHARKTKVPLHVAGLGIPLAEVQRYEAMVKDGHVLISVLTESGDQTERARMTLENQDVTDLGVEPEANSAWPEGASPPAAGPSHALHSHASPPRTHTGD